MLGVSENSWRTETNLIKSSKCRRRQDLLTSSPLVGLVNALSLPAGAMEGVNEMRQLWRWDWLLGCWWREFRQANDGGMSGRRQRIVACAPKGGRDCGDGGHLRIKESLIMISWHREEKERT
jgi:hypothetical protein